MLIQLYHADGPVGLQGVGVYLRHIVYRQAQAGDAVIQRGNIIRTAESRQNRWRVVARFTNSAYNRLFSAGCIGITARRFEVKARNREAEDTVVHREPNRRNHWHQVPLGRQAVQDTEHHEVDNVAVGVN